MGNTDIWAPVSPVDRAGSAAPRPLTNPGLHPTTANVDIGSHLSAAITAELASYCAASGASYAALLSENGVRIADAGPSQDLLGRSPEVPALAVGAFFATRELAGRLGESQFEGLYQQGANRHLFLSPVGKSHLLLAVFGPPTNVGIIRICAADTCPTLVRLLHPTKSTTLPTSPPEPEPIAPAPAPTEAPPPLTSLTPQPIREVADTLARPAPTGKLWPETPPLPTEKPVASKFPPEPTLSPEPPLTPLSAPTIEAFEAFENPEPPAHPFPSG